MSCRPWPARRRTGWAPCCWQVRAYKLQPELQPRKSSTQGATKKALLRWVELRGLEPLTPTLPVWCATSCATAPCRPGLVRPSREQLYRPVTPRPRRGGDTRRGAATRGRQVSALLHLADADVVAERIAEAEVDPVAAVDRLLGQVDALGLELGVGLVGVVGAEEQRAA